MSAMSTKPWRPAAFALCVFVAPVNASAHCDTLSGPVVAAARVALQKGDVTPALKWVKAADEAEVRQTFDRAKAVRQLNPEARELADRFFFETLVRLHRTGEGEPFTGLKPPVPEDDPLEAADAAIASGRVDALVKTLTDGASAHLRARFAEVMERRAHADDSVAAGREYVEAYVAFIHYVEELAGTP